MKYESIAQVYARLVLEGKRTLESIKNPIIRERVSDIVAEKKAK